VQILNVGLGSIIGITGIDGGLAVDMQAALDGFWQTDRLVVGDALPILEETGSTVMGPGGSAVGFGAFKDVLVHPEGTLRYTGTLNFFPNLFIRVVGVDFRFDLAEIPVELVDLDSNIIFDDESSHVPLPDIEITPQQVDFGEVTVGERLERLVRVRNSGEAPLEVSFAMPDAPFDVVETSLSIPPSSAVSFRVGFAPDEAIDYAGTLLVGSNDPDDALVLIRLSGTGLPAPEVDAGLVEDAGVDAGGGPSSAGGCGCRVTSAADSSHVWLLLAALGLAISIRRRRLHG
jgi:MYXO-CTERM domain-containing protein